MKKFVFSLGALFSLFAGLLVAMHLLAIWQYDKKIEREWKLRPDQDVLFVGSSQIGCSIVEDPQFHNKVIWTSSKPIQSTLARLMEMDRRGYLEGVKICAIRLNQTTIVQQNVDTLCGAWYNEFPFSWRYPNVYGCSYWKLLGHALTHLRYPFLFGINDVRPKGRPSIAERDEAWRKNFFSVIGAEARRAETDPLLFSDWQLMIDEALRKIQTICSKHHIRLIALDFPFLSHYVQQIPKAKTQRIARWKEHVKALGVEFVDLPESYGEDCYFDEAHMVERGSDHYTKNLYEKLGLSAGENRP